MPENTTTLAPGLHINVRACAHNIMTVIFMILSIVFRDLFDMITCVIYRDHRAWTLFAKSQSKIGTSVAWPVASAIKYILFLHTH